MRGVLALGMLVIILLSGCTVEKPTASANDAGQQDQSTSTASGSASATTTTGAPGGEVPGSNQAPTARLNATASNGTAPLNVTFTVDGMDPDGDALTWTLTAGNDTLGNGTSLPANVTHSFEAGNYTIVLTVRDGMANASANVTLVVEEGASEPAPPAGPTEDEWATFNPDGTCDAKGEILRAPSICTSAATPQAPALSRETGRGSTRRPTASPGCNWVAPTTRRIPTAPTPTC